MASLDATSITLAPGQEPFTLIPVIQDILRTRYCLAGSILFVEGLQTASVSQSGRWQAAMLLLGDGQLSIRALLGDTAHHFAEVGDVGVGCYVRMEKFDFRWRGAKKEDDPAKRMVYLVVENLITVGWNKPYRALWDKQSREAAEELMAENDLDFEETELEYTAAEADEAQGQELSKSQDLLGEIEDEDDAAIEDAFEAFEARTFPLKSSTTKSHTNKPENRPAATTTQPIALRRDWHDLSQPLKLTTLQAVPRLPYAQNWSCNILAIVASLSDVEPSHLPPYRQRTARIADPSTSKRVHLTVFLNPEEFAPKVGNAVLLVGVKNHRFDGGSLKKYASDKNEGTWWFEDPWDMGWCDVAGIKSWWAEMERSSAA